MAAEDFAEGRAVVAVAFGRGVEVVDDEVLLVIGQYAHLGLAVGVLVAVRRETFESVPVPEELKRRLAPYTKPADV